MASTWSTASTFETWRDDAVIGKGKGGVNHDDAIITAGSNTLLVRVMNIICPEKAPIC